MSFWFYWRFTQRHDSFLIRAVKQNKTWQLSIKVKILLRQRKTKVRKTQTKHQISKIKLLYMNLRAFFLYAFLFNSPRQHEVTLFPFTGYVTTIIEDAKIYATHAKKSSVDADDIKLAIQCRMDQSFTSPPPRDVRHHHPFTTVKENDHVFVWIMSILAGSWCLRACVSFSLFTLSVFNSLSLWCKRLPVYKCL